MTIRKIAMAASIAVLACVGARADDAIPLFKPGLWEISTTVDGDARRAVRTESCFDTAGEKHSISEGTRLSGKYCQSRNVAHDGNVWTVDARCALGTGLKTQDHIVISGDFDSKVSLTVNTNSTGAPNPQLDVPHKSEWLATRLGPCKAGQKAATVVLPLEMMTAPDW